MWQKQSYIHAIISTDLLVAVCIIFTLVGGITRRPIIFVLIGMIALYALLNWLYHRAIQRKLHLVDKPDTIRLFPGDKAILSFTLKNDSLFPYLNGKFSFDTNDIVYIKDNPLTNEKNQTKCELPFSVSSKGESILDIPFIAKKRGLMKIRNIQYQFPHLFLFSKMSLAYIPFYKQEIIVYPELKSVHGLDAYMQIAPGSQTTSISPFEDLESRVGTRDYTSQDPFQQINWKASVKTQRLQTNIYEQVIDASFVFMINLEALGGGISSQQQNTVEHYLSYMAYMAHYTMKNDFPFEVFINTRNPGRVPYVHIPKGAGLSHYIKTLEQLARIHSQPMISSMASLAYQVGKKWTEPKTIILIEDMLPEMESVISRWHAMHQVLHVKEKDSIAVLIPFQNKGGKIDAR